MSEMKYFRSVNNDNNKTSMENIQTYLPHLRGYNYTGKMPVVIDFFATWCGPCQAFAPALERLAKEHEGKIKVLKVDVDKNEALARAVTIRSVPTLFFIDREGNIERYMGTMPYDALKVKAMSLL